MKDKDKEIWAAYTRLVRPERKAKKSPASIQPSTIKRQQSPDCPLPAIMDDHSDMMKPVARLEREREKALRSGDIDIEGRIDLHGMTQAKAFAALSRFMNNAAKTEKRHLLIVTGKGNKGEGVLRSRLAEWLAQLPEAPSILALRPAADRHGGSGAFYVIMRKKRQPQKS